MENTIDTACDLIELRIQQKILEFSNGTLVPHQNGSRKPNT